MGLVSYGLYLPEHYETAEAVAARAGMSVEECLALGIELRYAPSHSDHPVPMAKKAAVQAFERAGKVTPEEVDLVLWAGEEYKDYIAQTASIRLQEEVGCKNAWAFDLVGQGVTSIQALRLAHDMIVGDRTVRTVLIAGGTRNIDLVDSANPDTRFLLPASASGSAMIVQRGYRNNRLLSTAFIVDAAMADEVYVPGGGTEHPFTPENLHSPMRYFTTPNPEKTAAYLSDRWPQALAAVVKKALGGQRLDYLALRHLSNAHRSMVLSLLGVSEAQSPSLNRYGHHGPNDAVLSLHLGLESGRIEEGSVVAMAMAGIGFTYASAVLRWG
ncbi:MAG: hypothetical protein HY788_21795 [Deltaproteobacteria bacterium]|nr:hypothetical protein [Deltaproteobacteria bacterium]